MLVASARKIPVKPQQMVDDNSGDVAFDSMKISHMNTQVDNQMVKKNKRSPLGTNNERSKTDESMEFVDAEDEVAELMHKDYTGSKRGRVPPSNN
ncbi:hypothetical protein BC332_05778 [Capsicum chinense]|nr:hypothetical protein BC332_05778 [Capsicum chinense]